MDVMTYRGVPVHAVARRFGVNRAVKMIANDTPTQRELWVLFQMATCRCSIGRFVLKSAPLGRWERP